MRNTSLKILIADDEEEARQLLLHYLSGIENIIIKEAGDGRSTLDALHNFSPDILFLDVKMPELSGIEVLEQKTAAQIPAVIFTTAFDEFALSAFNFEAVDYLLKPFDKERFSKAMKRAIEYVEFSKTKRSANYIKNLAVKTGTKTDLIPVEEIECIQADGPYVQVIAGNKSYLITETVYELEAKLDPSMFARIHRSVIVNIKYIKTIQSLLNGDNLLVLKSGKEVRASRTFKEKIKSIVWADGSLPK